MMRKTMTTGCLYCGLQLPETAEFCPQCGRTLERGFAVRPAQQPEFDLLSKLIIRIDDLRRQQGFSSHGSGPRALMEADAHLSK
jgi:hypothetical protein